MSKHVEVLNIIEELEELVQNLKTDGKGIESFNIECNFIFKEDYIPSYRSMVMRDTAKIQGVDDVYYLHIGKTFTCPKG